MKPFEWKKSVDSLENAITRLQDVLKQPIDPQGFIVDATILRFAFTFELFWKTVKRYLLIQGFETKTPRETLQKAYKLNWIDDEELWLDMLADRNQTSHVI